MSKSGGSSGIKTSWRYLKPKQIVVALVIVIVIIMISRGGVPVHQIEDTVDLKDFTIQVESVKTIPNTTAGDTQYDVQYDNLICVDDMTIADLDYPDWLQQPQSAEFQEHADKYQQFREDYQLLPGRISDDFYCHRYHRDSDQVAQDRQHYQDSALVIDAYAKNNQRLEVAFLISAKIDGLDLSQLQVQLVSEHEDLANKRLAEADLHRLLNRNPRSGQLLDTVTTIDSDQQRTGKAWADIDNGPDIDHRLKLEISYQDKLLAIIDLSEPETDQ